MRQSRRRAQVELVEQEGGLADDPESQEQRASGGVARISVTRTSTGLPLTCSAAPSRNALKADADPTGRLHAVETTRRLLEDRYGRPVGQLIGKLAHTHSQGYG
jgi:hypothetical protein